MWVIDERSAVDRPLAVICALECELVHLHATLGQRREEWHTGRRVWCSTVDNYPVVLACCGIGMLSAAAVTEAVIARYAPGAVLNYGCAGAHRADLLPGDLVIGSRTIAYDSVTMNPDGTVGNVRMWYLRAGVQHKVSHLSAAPHLVAAADQAAREWEGQYDAWPLTAGWPSAVPHRKPRIFVGTVASADRWNRSAERIRELAQKHGSLCEDMEAAAIALTCASHDVPFLTIKDISNNELLRMTDERFDAETEGQLGRRAAMLTLATMRSLVAQQRLTDAHGSGG